MGNLRRSLYRVLAFFRSRRAEDDLSREIDAHLQLLEDTFIAQGMAPDQARYAARRAFGGVEQTKERHRDARSFTWLAGWSMDLKLGTRMLIRYPGLTVVGGISMAFAIAVGAGGFEFLTQIVHPTLPISEGHRLVGLRNWDAAAGSVDGRAAHDFLTWRAELRSIEDLGAFHDIQRNLIVGETSEPVDIAEVSASAFRLAGVRPLLGRSLVDADEQSTAPPVAVVGYEIWQRRFAANPNIVGTVVRLGGAQTTIVGVMPERFTFPLAHSVWIPLRMNAGDYERRSGPALTVFGRLAPGVTLANAQAELTTIGQRAARDFPKTHEHLRPQVLPYARAVMDVSEVSIGLFAANVFFVMLLVLVCGNVALLIFARAATREDEIVVRTALGASRGRIIMQLFAEACALAALAAVVGVAGATYAMRWWMSVVEEEAGGRVPFWFHDDLMPTTVLYACLIAVLGAAIAGVVPAIKVTGRRVESRLRQASAGAGGLRFGGVWTAVIVAQIAVTVAFPATAFFARRHVVAMRGLDVGFADDRYLSARLEMDSESPGIAAAPDARAVTVARLRTAYERLARRLADEPDVVGVTFANRLPRSFHAPRRIVLDDDLSVQNASATRTAGTASVDVNYFDVLGVPMLAGRGFRPSDLEADARVVIVNQSFIDTMLRGRNPIGRRVRYVAPRATSPGGAADQPGPWFDIVGVVKDLGTVGDDANKGEGMYHPVAAGDVLPMYVVLHLQDQPALFEPRLRATAAAIDPMLRLHNVVPLDQVGRTMWLEMNFLFRLLIVVSSIALLLSLAGIYAVMSFTVTRRTREIGIRVALGASPTGIARSIFRRPLVQVAIGIIGGGALVYVLTQAVMGLSRREVGAVAAYIALMMAVCLLACIVPTRRALAIEPMEVLRDQ